MSPSASPMKKGIKTSQCNLTKNANSRTFKKIGQNGVAEYVVNVNVIQKRTTN